MMSEHHQDPNINELEQNVDQSGLRIPVILAIVLFVGILTTLGIGIRYLTSGETHILHSIFCLFFSLNLLICYWEICLFFQRDLVETRSDYWREWAYETGRNPEYEFMFGSVPLRQILSTALWADVWATYSRYDSSYADRRTFGFSADIGNGFVTGIPTLVLFSAFTVDFLPVLITGIIGVMMFWQWTYVTSLYWVSFFVTGKQEHVGRLQFYFYILGLNSIWVISALLGLYVSCRLILDGNYSVLGMV